MRFDALTGVLLVPAVAAALLATLPDYRLSARLNVLATTLTFVVPKEPKKAGIDPYNKLIDRTPEDNVTGVTRR